MLEFYLAGQSQERTGERKPALGGFQLTLQQQFLASRSGQRKA